MFGRTFISLIIFVLFSSYCYNCLKVIPERTIVKYVNEKYFSNVTATVRRSSKRGEYVFNIKLINKIQIGNNVTFNIVIYEHNGKYDQYVRTLMQFHYKWCEFVLHDIWFGPIIRKHGLTKCPTPAGPIIMSNMTFNGNFPFDVTFKKGKVESVWNVGPSGEVLGALDVFVSFSKF